jgi:hypothetical protein
MARGAALEHLAATRYHRGMNPEKTVHAENVPTVTDRPRRSIAHDEIARRAEQLWRERGQPSGQDEAIWLEAESQLQSEAEARPVSGTESHPYTDEPAKPLRQQTKSRDPADTAAQTRTDTQPKAKKSAGHVRNQ